MNVYEDKYLRDKVNRIIARQKEGKIVIAAYKDGSGLAGQRGSWSGAGSGSISI